MNDTMIMTKPGTSHDAPGFFTYYDHLIRSVVEFNPSPTVYVLCNSADIFGERIPNAPKRMIAVFTFRIDHTSDSAEISSPFALTVAFRS